MPRISIAVVMFLAILVAAIVAATVAFVPTQQAGVDGVDSTVVILRRNVIARLDNAVRLFFRGPGATATAWSTFASGGFDILSDAERLLHFLCSSVTSFNGQVGTVSVITPNFFSVCDNRLGVTLAGSTLLSPPFQLTMYQYDLVEKNFTLPLNIFDQFAYNTTEDWINRWGRIDKNTSWLPAHSGYDSVQISAAAPLLAADGTLVGRLSADFTPTNIGDQLAAIQLTPNSRAIVLDWNTKRVLGNNWGERPQILLARWAELDIVDELRMIFTTLDNQHDSLIARVRDELGGVAGIDARGDSFATTLFSGTDRTFVDVVTINDGAGLWVKILVAMPEDDFLHEIRATQRSTIGAVAGSLVAMLILAVIFAIFLSRPLMRLGRRMYRTASLQDDDEEDPTSLLSEIADMQSAYETMKRELNRMKAYLPQSLLQNDDDDDDDEDEGSMSDGLKESTLGESSSLNRSGAINRSGRQEDTESSHSRKSNRSSRSQSLHGGAAIAGGGLNMAKSIGKKKVCVAVINAVGFHSLVAASNSQPELKKTQSLLLNVVAKHARDNKGVVDTFHGDRVVLSFNAVNNVASASKRAVVTCLNICKELASDPTAPQISVGVASGPAAVGNMGSDTMQRFNIIGSVYPEAHMMERIARRAFDKAMRPWEIVVSEDVLPDTALEVQHQCTDIVRVGVSRVKLTARIVGLRSMATDEWMYQLKEGESSDPFAAANSVFELVASKTPDAQQLLDEAATAIEPTLLSRLRELVSGDVDELATIVAMH